MKTGEELTPREAINAMLDGEHLYTVDYKECFYRAETSTFRVDNKLNEISLSHFNGLYRRDMPKTRYMSRNECLLWATSPESIGYVVRGSDGDNWVCPQQKDYYGDISKYQRARLSLLVAGGYEVDPDDIEEFKVGK